MRWSNSKVIVTLIVNYLFRVLVCMNIPFIRQDDHKNKFSDDTTIIFFLSKFKAVVSLSIPIYSMWILFKGTILLTICEVDIV